MQFFCPCFFGVFSVSTSVQTLKNIITNPNIPPTLMESLIEAINAAIGTAVSKVATYPLDIVKTRLATSDANKTVKQVVTELTKEQGLGGLYFGVENKLVKSCTAKFIYFYIYRALLNIASGPNGEVGVASNLIIGYLGEFLSLPVVMPLEAIVSKSQTDGISGRQAIDVMYKEGGMDRFYAAKFAYVMGCCQPAIQYTIFDQIKRAYLLTTKSKNAQLGWFAAFMLGAMTNIIAVTSCYPLEVIRMTQQSKGKSATNKESDIVIKREEGFLGTASFHANEAFNVAREIIAKDGTLGMFKGLGPQLTASVFASALMLMVKERILAVSSRVLYSALMGTAPPRK